MKTRFLANTPLFAVLSDEERSALAEHFTLHQYESGTALFKMEEPSQAMYLIKSGMVRVLTRQEGAERLLATYGPSSILGDVDVLLNRPHDTTAVTHGAVDAWRFDRAALAEVMSEHPSISIKLSSMLGERIADVEQYLVARLQRISVLGELGEDTLKVLVQVMTLRDARQNALLFQAGTPANHLYFIENGKVSVVSSHPDDPEPFRELGTGEVFGHEAVLNERPYGAVARAATDVQLWLLSKEEFERIAAIHPSLRQVLSDHIKQYGLIAADRTAARQALAEVPFFVGLPHLILDALVSRMIVRHVGTNEVLFSAGDLGDAFYLVDQGVIKFLRGNKLVERKEAGEYFGEDALLTGTPRSLTARAVRPTNLWALLKRDFDILAVRYSELPTFVSRALAKSRPQDSPPDPAEELNLSMFPLFTGLTPREQVTVGRRMNLMSIGEDEVIFHQGSIPDAFYLVRRGKVKLESSEGVFDLVRSGGFFGEMALLTGKSHSMSARSLEDSELLLLDRVNFEAILRHYAPVAFVLSRALSARLERANARGTIPYAPTPDLPLITAPQPVSRAESRPLPSPAPMAEMMSKSQEMLPPPTRSYSRWAQLKFLLVLLPTLWLSFVVAPTLLVEDIQSDPAHPLRPILSIIPTLPVNELAPIDDNATPTAIPTQTPESGDEEEGTPTP